MDEEENPFLKMLNEGAGAENAPAPAIEATETIEPAATPAEEENPFLKLLEEPAAPVEAATATEEENPFLKLVQGNEEPSNAPQKIPTSTSEAEKATTPIDPEATLMKDDLLRPEFLPDIRKFMTLYYGKGTEYEEMEPQEVVDEFVTNMRWFNTNFLSTANMGAKVLTSTEEEKAAAFKALQTYDRLGNVFVNDGIYGAATGVADYVGAMVADPTNYIGLLTLGIGKAGTAAATKAGVEAVKLAAKEAGKQAMAAGAKEGVEAAARAAASSMAAKLAVQGTKSAVAKAAVDKVYQETLEFGIKKAGVEGAKEVAEAVAKSKLTKDVLKTTAVDSTLAMAQNAISQSVYIDVGAQEDFSALQLGISGVGGAIGGGAHLMFNKFSGISKLGDATVSLAMSQESRKLAKLQEDMLKVTKPSVYEATDKIFKETLTLWEDKVAAGRVVMGDAHRMPHDILKNVLFGADGTTGLAKVFKDEGIEVNRDMRVTDFLTNYMEMLPKEDRLDVSKRLHNLTGITLGDFVYNPQTLGNIISETASEAGSYLGLLGQFSRGLDSGIVAGTAKMGAETTKKIKPRYLAYAQNNWRKLLVSTPQTAMANIFGAAQFYGGQTIADLFSSATYGALALVSTGAKRGEYWRLSKSLMHLQHQKLLNLMDPFTTHDTYMAFLDQHKDVQKILHESMLNGIETTAERFGLNPNAPMVKLTEAITDTALKYSGTRVQDSFMKSQFFINKIDKALRMQHKTTFLDVIREGKWELVDTDIQKRAMDDTLEGIMSFDYTKADPDAGEIGQNLARAARLVEGISNTPVIGTILPFGRFMNNIVAYTYKWSPFGLLDLAKAIGKEDKVAGDVTDIFSRALVGGGFIASAMVFAENQEKNGRAMYDIDVGGNIVNVQNVFPASMYIAFGAWFNKRRKGQDASVESEELMKQIAIGQVAGNVEFGNDLNAMYRYMSNDMTDGDVGKLLEHVYTQMGNVTAGFVRPLDPLNKIVGVIADVDVSRDLRTARGPEIFTKRATRYVDNLFEGIKKAITGDSEVPGVSAPPLKLATRSGEVRDPAPFSSMFGLRETQPKTNTERVFDAAGIVAWKESFYSGVQEYDRLANERVQPILDKLLSPLLKDKRFLEGDQNSKRNMVKERVSEAQKIVKNRMKTESPQTALEAIRLRINDMSDKKVAAAINSLKDRGIIISTSDPRDMTYKECQTIIDFLKLFESGYEYKTY